MSKSVNINQLESGKYFLIEPEKIVVNSKLRGRVIPPTKDDVYSLAVSIATNPEGQLMPVGCRKLKSNELELSFGFTRYEAVALLRKGFEFNGEKYHLPNLKLKINIFECDELEAFLMNIDENKERNDTNPIDDAVNQEKLRKKYKLKNNEIAARYKWSTAKVTHYIKLNSLNPNEQYLVASGKMPVSVALILLEIDSDKRDQALNFATNDVGKVQGAKLKKFLRDDVNIQEEEDEKNNIPKPKRTSSQVSKSHTRRSMKEVRDMMRILSELYFKTDKPIDGIISDFVCSLNDFSEGTIDLDKLIDNLREQIELNVKAL